MVVSKCQVGLKRSVAGEAFEAMSSSFVFIQLNNSLEVLVAVDTNEGMFLGLVLVSGLAGLKTHAALDAVELVSLGLFIFAGEWSCT